MNPIQFLILYVVITYSMLGQNPEIVYKKYLPSTLMFQLVDEYYSKSKNCGQNIYFYFLIRKTQEIFYFYSNRQLIILSVIYFECKPNNMIASKFA